jgi:hypothetical protein
MRQFHLTVKVSLKTKMLLTKTVIQWKMRYKFGQATTNIQTLDNDNKHNCMRNAHLLGYKEINRTKCQGHTERLTIHSQQ